MSRERKFRVWDKLDKRYTYPDSPNTRHFVMGLDGQAWNLQNGAGGVEFEVEEWTGLTDKNGKDIYEGDVIQLNTGEAGVVKFKGGRYFHEAKSEIVGQLYWDKVIGNLNENPELIQ